MAREVHHERLSALDTTFLGIEDRCCHMHIGSVGVFEAPQGADGRGLDIDAIHHLVSTVLDTFPRYRQRLETIPLLEHPVWVDDPSFNLHYHLRHTRLPLPVAMRVVRLLIILSLVTVGAGGRVEALVLCAHDRQGVIDSSLKVRAQCRSREVQVDPVVLDLQGPPGPTGPPGSPGPLAGCTTSCVSGGPTVTFNCGGEPRSCSSGDPVNFARAIFIDCTTADSLAQPFCLMTDCHRGVCPGDPPHDPCVGSAPVEVDARNAVDAMLAYFANSKTFLAGSCTALPGFTPSPGVSCTTTGDATCFSVSTATSDPDATSRQCVFNACETPGGTLVCS